MRKITKIIPPSRSNRADAGIRALCSKVVTLRQLHGYSQRDFADKIEVSRAQLCKFEKGKHLPHADFLDKIERGFGLPPQSLVSIRNRIAKDACYDDGDHFDDPYVRFVPACDETSITEAEMRRLTASIEPLVEEYTSLLDRLNLPSFGLVDLGNLRTSSVRNGIDYAEGLRDFIGDYTASFAALLPRLEQLNFHILPMPDLPPVDLGNGKYKMRVALAFHDMRRDSPVIVVNEQAPSYSQLYEIAYEIGSYFRYYRQMSVKCRHLNKEWVFCRPFATTLLVPTIIIRDIVNQLYIPARHWDIPLIENLAQRFGVSSTAMLYRLDSIGAIDKKLCAKFIEQLRKPHACDDPTLFPPRPPLQFGTWLTTLRLRAKLKK